MKRIVLDVPKWHVYLHREARDLASAEDSDGGLRKLEDEIFDRLYSGDAERLPAALQDPQLRSWAESIHGACEKLPAFARLGAECRGEPVAAGLAVETLMAELAPELPKKSDPAVSESTRRRTIGRACERASATIDELRDAVDALAEVGFTGAPGRTSAAGGTLPHSSIRSLAARLKSDGRLKQIARLAGRMKRIAGSKRRQKIRHGADEIADIEEGADLGRLLPSELVRLAHPALRLAAMRSLVERSALQYQLAGQTPLGEGPLVLALDKSGSMDGPRDIWATALALALLQRARSEIRSFALVCFDSQVKFEAVVRPGEPLPEEALFTACAGGTEIASALERSLAIIADDAGALRKADVVLVTDGGSDTTAAAKVRSRAASLGVTILGLGIGVEREWLLPWYDEVQVVSDVSRLDDETAAKLFAA